MTWFKVDDKFHSHAKVARLGDDSDALALWVVAGSWCADQLTDGWVPAFVARRLDPDYVRRAAALVRVGLWEEEQREDEKGWVFHGWNEEGRQPTAEQVQQERAAKSARQQRWRERMRAEREARDVDASTRSGDAADVDAHGEYSDYGGDDSADSRASGASTSASTRSGGSTGGPAQSTESRRNVDASTRRRGDGGVDGAPTRPDPTRPITTKEPPASSLRSDAPPKGRSGAKRGTRIPDDFAITETMRAWGRANAPHVDGERETVKFVNHFQSVPGQRGVKLNWERTWQNWILKAAEQGSSPVTPLFPASPQAPRPTWCGLCDERTRMVLDEDDQPERCPRCHPRTQKETTP